MTAYIIESFTDQKMEIIYRVFWEMWIRGEINQLDAACAALLKRDIREAAERRTMRLKVGV